MATTKELESQIQALQQLLEQHGIVAPKARSVRPEDRPDYIPFGSEKYLGFLGMIEVEDLEWAKESGFTVYTSPQTKRSYRLQDEIAPVNLYRGIDPDKAIRLVLRQKVGQFESGAPKVPDDAPSMFVTPDNMTPIN